MVLQVAVCIWIALAWAVFTTQAPYDTYSRLNEGETAPDFDVIRLPGGWRFVMRRVVGVADRNGCTGRVLGIVMTIPGAYMVYRFGKAMYWMCLVLLACAGATLLSQADVSQYVVNLRQCVGIPLYPIMWTVTTRGLEKRVIPTIAAPHILARVLATTFAYLLSLWVWDSPDAYDTALATMGFVCIVGAGTAYAFCEWDEATGGTINLATSDRARAVRTRL